MALKDDILHLIRTDPEVRQAVRREVLTDELLTLPDRLAATAAEIAALADAQRRTEEAIAGLTARMETLATQTARNTDELTRLSESWRGEIGRREGERYEQVTIRRAYSVFGGGRNAAARPEDEGRIRRALDGIVSERVLPEADDPWLADLLWMKGDRIAVVEISRQVDPSDVERAERRAATLRTAGLEAFPLVVGRDWTSDDVETLAREHSVEWRVAEDGSGGYLAFRRALTGEGQGFGHAGRSHEP